VNLHPKNHRYPKIFLSPFRVNQCIVDHIQVIHYASLLLHFQHPVHVVLLVVQVDDPGTQTENRHALLDLDSSKGEDPYYSSSRLNIQSNYGPDDSDKTVGLNKNKNAVGSFESSVSDGSGRCEKDDG